MNTSRRGFIRGLAGASALMRAVPFCSGGFAVGAVTTFNPAFAGGKHPEAPVPKEYASLQKAIDRVTPKEFAAYLKGGGVWEPGSAQATVFSRLDAAFDKVLDEVRKTRVADRPAIWFVYNLGFVVKTKSACFTLDLSHRKAREIAPLVDFALVTHAHADHYTKAYCEAVDGAGKVVVSNFMDNAGVKDPQMRGFVKRPGPREFRLKDVEIRATFTDHSPRLPADFTSPFEIRIGDFTIFGSGDCCNVEKLNPTRRPDLWLVHPYCGMRTADGVRRFHPVRTVIGHLNELSHISGKNRWTWGNGFKAKADAEAAGGEAIVPLWGDRIM